MNLFFPEDAQGNPLLFKGLAHTIKRVGPMELSHNNSALEMHVF